jgi:hypothetical protein
VIDPERWVQDPATGKLVARYRKHDPQLGTVPESDAEALARVKREAQEQAAREAYSASEAGQLRARHAARLGHDPAGAWDTHEADALLALDAAEAAHRAARAPVEAAQVAARTYRAGLPLRPTHAEQAALARLEDATTLLEREVDPALLGNVQAAHRRLEQLREDRRRGAPPPRAHVLFTLDEESKCLLAHGLAACAMTPGDVYGPRSGIGLKPGSPCPSWRGLYQLAGLKTAGKSFDDDDNRQGLWLCDDQAFQKKLAHALRAGLQRRFGLDAAAGEAIRRRDESSYTPTAPQPVPFAGVRSA